MNSRPDSLALFATICGRENAPFSVVGKVTADGKIVVHDSNDDSYPVDLQLQDVMGDMPQKTFCIDPVGFP